jgi:NSS family neurotransmitter:Na+ symporter
LFAAFIYAFFKLNVGTGIMIVYGSYLPLSAPLGKSALYVVLFDIIASLLAYFAIYPLVLNSALTAMVKVDYQMIHHLFTQVAGGNVAVILFFLAATLAAWMPTIAITESIVVTLMERFDLSRRAATLMTGIIVLILATMIILSYSEFVKLDVNRLLTLLSDNILIPISALFTAIFIAWVVSKKTTFDELGFSSTAFNLWHILVRYVAPVLCLVLLIVNFS